MEKNPFKSSSEKSSSRFFENPFVDSVLGFFSDFSKKFLSFSLGTIPLGYLSYVWIPKKILTPAISPGNFYSGIIGELSSISNRLP